MGPVQQQSIRGEAPNWEPVPDNLLTQPPYLAVCQIITEGTGGQISSGTGWLGIDGIVMTAAHVLAGQNYEAQACRIFWPAIGAWQDAPLFKVHPEFRLANGSVRIGSGADVGKLGGFQTFPGAALDRGSPSRGLIELAGFQDGILVRGVGNVKSVSPFVGHGADALAGHSGGPVLSGGRVVGLHVASASVSRRYLPAADARTLDTLNSAVGLSQASTGFPLQ